MKVLRSILGLVFAALLSVVAVQFCNAQQYSAQAESALLRAARALTAGKYADAVKEYREANKVQNGSCFDCYLGLVSAYTKAGDLSHADESAAKAISVAKTPKEQAIAHTARGSVLMRYGSEDAKRSSAAEGEFRQALSADSSNAEARFALGVCLLKEKKDDEGVRELKAAVASDPNASFVRQAESLVANPRRAREWFAPDFTVSTLQGETLALHDLSGKIVVLDFWATWCPSCRDSIPEIKELLTKYPREKLAVISVSGDADEAAWKDFIGKKKMEWPQVLGRRNFEVMKAFRVNAFPTYIIIDGEGAVRQRIVGIDPHQSIAARLRDTLKGMKELE